MATLIASHPTSVKFDLEKYRHERRLAAALVTGLTFFALLIHGYHPYAEDGGIYLPEIKKLLDPGLYPSGTGFVVGHLAYSFFAQLIAGLVRKSHLSLGLVLLLVYLASIWMTLFAAWLLAARCYRSREARSGAVTLLAVWLTIPIAGTSLMLMDPYVTARSLSTPCALLAMVGILQYLLPRFESDGETWERRRGLVLCGGALVAGGTMHPLMSAYALGSVLLLITAMSWIRQVRVWGTIGLCLTALVISAIVQRAAPAESIAYKMVMMTRSYWFLSQWHWYEWAGLIGPLLILSIVVTKRAYEDEAPRVGLAHVAIASGITAMAVAVLFARMGAPVHQVARLQPLRIFQLVYIVMILAAGAALGEWALRRRAWRWIAAFSLLATVMFLVNRETFPASKHLELPDALSWDRASGNNYWEQAFVWVRDNTPKNAIIALDAYYTVKDGEDAQNFRAIGERSSVPDSKDGGTATNRPALAEAWAQGMALQTGIDKRSDPTRFTALKSVGATWVILERGASVGFGCVYENKTVKVCRLP
ncbi:hypothetical protein [Granulicella sp. S190]|uniref:hypothetical protein n=1 Tax=Granulicella sp. S190 TaxID=1747226 RepID=UPI00131C08A4|nr:hypothetical protein [Granulicella sp. S190]